MNIKETISKMTLKEKVAMLCGKDFWRTKDYEKFGIPSMEVADGPCGLRKQMETCDHLGINTSLPATANVSGPTLAASWDKELIYKVGENLGKECVTYNVDVLLGPAINIQRSPLCGRHFEYFSEDPYLTGIISSEYIKGVQSQGVGTCVKHYAANNQETEREYIDTLIDERALREIYLAAFEEPIKSAKPWSVMTALNKVNGEYCAENTHLLKDILREEWGYEGFVMSDWWGVNDRARAVEAGLDLEMPYSDGVGQQKIEAAIEKNILDEKFVDESCERLIKYALKIRKNKKDKVAFNIEEHHLFARKAAEQSIVLLKNQEDILPLRSNQRVALIGEFMMKPKFKMEGSALVNPTMEDIPFEEIKKISTGVITYAPGYSIEGTSTKELLEQAKQVAKDAEVAIIFVGLPHGIEAEGHDRKNIHLPQDHLDLIEVVTSVQSNVIVILANGGPVDMPWLPKVKAVFECFLAGQAVGGALTSLLYGIENPSGKLPVTFPKQLSNTPSYFNFPGDKLKVEYKEGVFVGYRYYDKAEIEPLFPFGYGLSYTKFQYSNLTLDKKAMMDKDFLTVNLKVKNIGKMAGREVVQLYVGHFDSSVLKPIKELRGFEKIYLAPEEEKTVTFKLDKRAFAFYQVDIKDWYVDKGEYKIMIGSSSKDILLEDTVIVTPVNELPKKITGWSKVERFRETKVGREILEEIKKMVMENYCDDNLRKLFLKEEELKSQLDNLRIRFITLYTQTVINNDIMDEYLRRCNEEYISEFIKKQQSIEI